MKKQKLPTSKIKNTAYIGGGARDCAGVTGCFQLNKKVVLKLLTAKKMTPPNRVYLLDTKMVLSYGVTKHDTLQN